MNINKKYKLEEVCSKDATKYILQSVYVYQNGRTWAVATDGKALAKVPVEVEEKELERGNSIKASDFKFQRSNPELKKKQEMYVALEPIASPYPSVEAVFPKDEHIVEFGIDVSLLMSLSKALGTDKLTIKVIDNQKPLQVLPYEGGEAHGLICPLR